MMGDLLKLIWYAVAGLFRSRAALQTEVLVLRHQLNVLRRKAPKRVAISKIDRLVRTHLSPHKDAPIRRDVCRTGRVLSLPILGGLHHQYVRV
jgi:hypothetical protein